MDTGRSRIILVVVIVVALADFAVAVYAALEAPIPVRVSLGTPMAYKNIYLHVPIAVTTYVVLAGALISSILYLWRVDERYSKLADSYVEYGIMFGAATLVTGSSWASESWGSAWNWDPKETAVLFLFLAYLAYFPLKNSIGDPDRANRVGAAYAIAAFVMVPLSFLASRVMESLHPTGEAIAEFAGGGSGGAILGVRIVLLSVLGVLLPLLHASGRISVPRVVLLAILSTGLIVAGYIAYPTLAGGDVRVVEVSVDSNGMIRSITLSNGETVTFDDPLESPIKPPLTRDGQSTLVGHIVDVGEGEIRVLYHWSTPFTLMVYSILLSAGLYLVGGRR